MKLIKGRDHKLLWEMQIKLFEVATGPIHHDLFVKNKETKIEGRLYFDIKMSQITKL